MATRPITDTLRLLDGGAFLDRCSEELASVVRRVRDTGKAGKVTITLEVKAASKGAMSLVPNCVSKIPEPKSDPTMLWDTVEGNLVVDNPSQQRLDLRQVDQATGEILRDVAPSITPINALRTA